MHLLIAALFLWGGWNASAVADDRGYPVFSVDNKPFFVYGASFFYERVPRNRWAPSLAAYRAMGINTIDLYVMWNWHQPSAEVLPDFRGATNPQRDLLGLLRLIHRDGFKVILRPGPVIRNEWRNGGYPYWLLKRPEYRMPLRDILEGRYPATATLQNAHADAAAAEWLANETHLRYASQWLRDVLTAVTPYRNDVIAIALDDDQGAYMDNDTYPAPHWHDYVDWLRDVVQDVTGPRVPLFINTAEMKVPAAAPAWAWGDWYQSDAYAIGAHDIAQLDFATGLLQTQPHVPVMLAEFQAGWLQGADEGAPRPADPSNTALALNELLRDGAHGIVNFPVQDTVNPDGWEAPWANWDYSWDAALDAHLQHSPRYAPTAAFGANVATYGALLARTHPAFDAAIVWPPTLFAAGAFTNADFAAFADETRAMQHDCRARRLTCALIDLAHAGNSVLERYPVLVLPIGPTGISRRLSPSGERTLLRLFNAHRIVADLSHVRPRIDAPETTLLLSDSGNYAFVDTVNSGYAPRRIGPLRVAMDGSTFAIGAFTVPPRSARLIPVGVPRVPPAGAAPRRSDSVAEANAAEATSLERWSTGTTAIAFGANAGARIRSLTGADSGDNAASDVGLLRDAVDPEPSPSARDYIAAYTHPMPAGTFNRPYDCGYAGVSQGHPLAVRCLYEAPDIPDGGALFERTIRSGANGDVVVTEHFLPHDAAATARLKSISGFAFADGDVIVAPAGVAGIGMLHGTRFATLRWNDGDVAHVDVRQTRGAAIVTLICTRRNVEFHLAVTRAASPTEAEALLRANPRQAP
ncbi:MAG: beta-galactosidase [Candidatus Eremiobacteraeota bacterium]|nr:beta-galactosidase [Candidatus Eremiobacteraeota bacterium]